jgi:hypothetical protein
MCKVKISRTNFVLKVYLACSQASQAARGRCQPACQRIQQPGPRRRPAAARLAVTGTYADADDPNTVIVVVDMNDLAAAREYAQSTTLADARQRAGVTGQPEGVWYGAAKLA